MNVYSSEDYECQFALQFATKQKVKAEDFTDEHARAYMAKRKKGN